MPVESNTMTSSLDWRGGARLATIWPNSVTRSRVMTPAAIAWCRSPIVAAWSRTSTTTRLAASTAGAISCFSGLSAPTAATNDPGATSPDWRIGSRDDVQVTTLSLVRAAAAGPSATSIVRPSSGPSTRASSSAQRRDLHGIEERQGRAHLGVGEDDHALDGGEALRGVVREVGVGLRREVGPAEAQHAGLDVKSAALDVEAERLLDSGNAGIEIQQIGDVAAGEQQRRAHYWTAFTMSKMGRYMATTMPPT